MIEYRDRLQGVTEDQLQGPYFEGWANPPRPTAHLRILQGSSEVVLAVDSNSSEIVGFITAVSDGVLCAYIPLLEVLPNYRGQGIGSELLRRMLARLESLYMLDIVCDPHLQPFYQRHGLQSALAMIRRNYGAQYG